MFVALDKKDRFHHFNLTVRLVADRMCYKLLFLTDQPV